MNKYTRLFLTELIPFSREQSGGSEYNASPQLKILKALSVGYGDIIIKDCLARVNEHILAVQKASPNVIFKVKVYENGLVSGTRFLTSGIRIDFDTPKDKAGKAVRASVTKQLIGESLRILKEGLKKLSASFRSVNEVGNLEIKLGPVNDVYLSIFNGKEMVILRNGSIQWGEDELCLGIAGSTINGLKKYIKWDGSSLYTSDTAL